MIKSWSLIRNGNKINLRMNVGSKDTLISLYKNEGIPICVFYSEHIEWLSFHTKQIVDFKNTDYYKWGQNKTKR